MKLGKSYLLTGLQWLACLTLSLGAGMVRSNRRLPHFGEACLLRLLLAMRLSFLRRKMIVTLLIMETVSLRE